ncbi:hypothetical protein [Micromonospora sp. MA102]|uniref:hypothetical protein n=1 Tax=Micromonospora sp. MA102 TaxID=2952755 RepID=UPI0021CA0015|nr:hypothetical protein [Micromonospora sp. MA102]
MSDPDDGPPVRLVLDRSTLLAYLAGSVHVGETLHEVIADGVRFGVTAVAAAEAYAAVDDPKDRAALRRLLALDACAVLPTDGGAWQELAYWRAFTGRVDLAATVLACLDHDAPILTGEGRYGTDELPVIRLPE